MPGRILLIDDDADDRRLLAREIRREEPDVAVEEIADASGLERALDAPGLAASVIAYQLGWTDGLSLLATLKARHPDAPVVMFTRSGGEEIAVRAMKAGLDDYIVKSQTNFRRVPLALRHAITAAEQGRALRDTERRLQEQAARLAEETRRKDAFLATLAHELRNPLASIVTAAHLLGLRQDEARRARSLATITRQARRLTRMVDDLLDVSRLTRGMVSLRQESVDLSAVVESAVEANRAAIDDRRLTLSVTAPPDPVRALGDTVRLEQVISNLLENAAKYTQPGGRITLVVEREPGLAVVRVRDSGIGLAPAFLPHVFDLFSQADRTLDRSQGGLGIGLTLVRNLVERHGGTVEAMSDGPGKGSEFVVRLPAAPGPRAAEEASAAAAAPARRILVVEDNEDAGAMLVELLQIQGHDVHLATDGPSALEATRKDAPDLVLLDIGLPGMDGYQVARRLRQEGNRSKLVALTGYGQEEDCVRSREAGFDLHLTKPVAPEVIERIVAERDPR